MGVTRFHVCEIPRAGRFIDGKWKRGWERGLEGELPVEWAQTFCRDEDDVLGGVRGLGRTAS